MIYVCQNGDEHTVKIGYTASGAARIRDLQTANAQPLRVIGWIDGDQDVERRIHERFADSRINGEWFSLTRDLAAFITANSVEGSLPWSEPRVVTPDLAKTWLETYRYAKQRPIRQMWVNYLAREMRGGRFRPTASVIIAQLGPMKYLINGYHTLYAILASGLPQIVDFKVMQCDTSESVDELYAVTDFGRPRTFKDAARVYDLQTQIGIPETWISNLGSATLMIFQKWSSSVRATDIDTREHVAMCVEYGDAAKKYYQAMRQCDHTFSKTLQRQSTMSIGLVTMRFAGETADEFWRGIVEDDGLKKGDPRRAARRHLETSIISGGGGLVRNLDTRVVTRWYSARYMANCWNAWLDYPKKEIQYAKVMDESAPIRILMTPYVS